MYRRHTLAPQCVRCCLIFADEAKLIEHQREPEGCVVRIDSAADGLNKKQVDQLHKNMEEAAVKLQEVRTNTTLITLCNAEPGLRSHGANVAEKQEDGSIGSGEF